MDVTVTLYDLGLLVLFVLLVVAISSFIVVARKFYDLLGNLHKTLEANETNIKRSLAVLPEMLEKTDDIASNMQLGAREFGASVPTIIHNFSAISDSLRDSADLVVDSVDLIGTGISETVYNVKERSGDVASYAKIIMEALHYIVNYLTTK
ncbi:MAG: hypothetical protein U1E11_10150 [Dethiobacteria bacterium]|nr:hypothetical protein [Dethiobacteria bacterium]